MSDELLFEKDGPVATLTLNRPDRRNALCIELLEQLCQQIDQLKVDHRNRVVVLRGAGPVFSAGLDLKEAADSSLVQRSATAVSRSLERMRTSSLITIAAVQGGAVQGRLGHRDSLRRDARTSVSTPASAPASSAASAITRSASERG